jgi:uncharacterized membrane protein (DUF485 family)
MDSIAKEKSPQRPVQSDWDKIANSPEFKHLVALKKTFILPAFTIFFVYYFALPIAVGFAPKWMSTAITGDVTLGYLFALSQFVFGGIIAWLYLGASAKFDALTGDILRNHEESREGKR